MSPGSLSAIYKMCFFTLATVPNIVYFNSCQFRKMDAKNPDDGGD